MRKNVFEVPEWCRRFRFVRVLLPSRSCASLQIWSRKGVFQQTAKHSHAAGRARWSGSASFQLWCRAYRCWRSVPQRTTRCLAQRAPGSLCLCQRLNLYCPRSPRNRASSYWLVSIAIRSLQREFLKGLPQRVSGLSQDSLGGVPKPRRMRGANEKKPVAARCDFSTFRAQSVGKSY